MKDIDFDELDRAVSSVMQTDPAVPDQSITDTPVTPEVPSAPELVIEQPEESQSTPVVTDSLVASAPALAPAIKRSGRFMDVMHPSADMRPAAVTTPSREGITIATTSTDTPATQSETETPAEEATPANVPDAFDDATPLQSPFLPDAQVEKRPLGSNTPTSVSSLNDMLAKELAVGHHEDITVETAPMIDSEPTTSAESPDDQLPPKVEAAPLPAELGSDLVAIESGEAQVAHESSPVAVAPEPQVTPTPGGGSIPQQYAEQPSTGDQSHMPIYDTDLTVEPLAHPAKKKSGWLVVLWVAVFMLLGAGATLAFYFLA